ncbi:hypothetical protein [Sphingobacterium lumbrici]|uniref:hypothetical protein n=1 Tax=Sphingobacterium lumbrici TaxID=2559600 RepID=UPI0011293536|nr:hypothetical protein [Sphingobacterium lumbrici]
MKRILYILALLIGLQGCEKEGFDYAIYQPQAEDVSSLYFSTGSPTLIADGKASLQFVLETYRTIQIKDAAGQLKDTSMFMDYRALPESAVQIYVDEQRISGMEYSTTDVSKTSISCYAQIGNIKSEVKEVAIRQPKDVGAKRYVDVVFHVLELSPTDQLYDPLTYQEVTPKQLNDAVSYANTIFSNKVGKDPNGGSANIEFRLATKNVSGATLAIPGYNKIIYDMTWKNSSAATAATLPYNLTHFTNRINATVAYQWDKSRFLNIYVIPSSPNNSIGEHRAAYQIVPVGQTAIAGIDKIVTSETEVPTTDFYTNYGLGIHRSVFFPDPSRKIEIASYFARYYGLYSTNSTGTSVNDYVTDTRKYLTGTTQTANVIGGLLKVGIDGEKFLANNAMDDIRYASLRNSLTQGQVDRIRLVMERSPVRKAWSLQ